ncbi:MAG: anthranilate synthase component I [Chthonomonadales bacterium]|nr:anthranilate synthase component I [Chthonomonadales bacterium]
MHSPTREQFLGAARPGDLVPIVREILADRLTPVSAFERLPRSGGAFLLESVEGGERIGRYSFLGSAPRLALTVKGRTATVREGRRTRTVVLTPSDDGLTVLKELLGRYRYVPQPGLPRFCGGAVGYLAYDMARCFERLPERAADDLGLEDAFFLFTDTLLIFDHVKHRVKVLCNARVDSDPALAYDRAVKQIDSLVGVLRGPTLAAPPARPARMAPPTANMEREAYEAAVEKCREYIAAGDAFQIVPSVRFDLPVQARPFELYRALRSVNPSPYMYFIDTGQRQVVGSSPEILVTVEGRRVTVRPIAGTRPRGVSFEEDERLASELLADEKERAEHIMLVDLGRNDVGRVSEYGTVHVDELMAIERYSHVMHIVSNVTGRLAEGRDVFDVTRACFPAGTLTGAPKVRAMEIIEELEPTRRGLYGGAVGYFSYSGDADLAIAIRTMLLNSGRAYVQVGAGVVADSVPAREYEECLNKARAVMAAIEMAEAGLD